MIGRRNQEMGLLLLVLIVALIGFLLVQLSRTPSPSTPPAAGLAALVILPFFVLHLLERRLAPEADPLLLPLAAFLTSLGTMMLYRLKPELVSRQSLWITLGALGALGILLFLKDYAKLENYKYLCALSGITLLLSPALFGEEIRGAKLWLRAGQLSFQPAEVGKILLVIFLAAYLKDKGRLLSLAERRLLRIPVPDLKHFGPLLTMWAISLAILILEKDLGSSLLFFGIFLAMLYVATGREMYSIIGCCLFLAGATACYLIFGHVQMRIDIWLNPWQDVAKSGYQIVQSLFAIANGGLFGTGLGLGYPNYIPAVHTDFIFSALAEELGLAGGLGVLAAYLLFAHRGFRLALETEDEFGKLLAVGLTSTFLLQALVIIGGATKLIPLTGITLPLMSYGGSSILSNFILLGLLLAISQKTAQGRGT